MTALVRALGAETLKLKRTLVLWLVIIAPSIIVSVRFLEWTQHGRIFLYPGVNPWTRLTQSILSIWSMLMLPLFIILETTLLSGLEHAGEQWKHLFALPIPRWAVYAAKQLTGLGLIGLSTLVLWVEIPLAGSGLRLLKPELDFAQQPIPWLEILRLVVLTYLTAWLIVAIHTWVSVRWSSFTLAIGIGIAATFFGLITTSTEFGRIYPWSLPVSVVFGQGERLPLALALSTIGSIVVGVVGSWECTHRDIL
ncbi:MAG: ABC transporter permease [Chloroflexota bacterium]|nr:ABC transporter permease [Chloroflexota bacterium]